MERKGKMYVCVTVTHVPQQEKLVAQERSDCVVDIDEKGSISVKYSENESEVVYDGKKHPNGVFHLTGQGEGKATLCQISADDSRDVVFVGDWHRPNIAEGVWKITLTMGE